MPRPRSLTHEQIAAAALAVIDRDGLVALSMRTVAAEMRVGTMSVYRYVSDRGQVERLVVDLVLASVELTVPNGQWRDQITAICERIRVAVTHHAGVVPLFLAHRQSSPSVQRCGEALLGIMARAGFDGTERVIAFRAVLAYLTGALTSEHLGPLSGAGTKALAELPRTDYPYLADTAVHARRVSADDEFRGGLRLLLNGLGR